MKIIFSHTSGWECEFIYIIIMFLKSHEYTFISFCLFQGMAESNQNAQQFTLFSQQWKIGTQANVSLTKKGKVKESDKAWVMWPLSKGQRDIWEVTVTMVLKALLLITLSTVSICNGQNYNFLVCYRKSVCHYKNNLFACALLNFAYWRPMYLM